MALIQAQEDSQQECEESRRACLHKEEFGEQGRAIAVISRNSPKDSGSETSFAAVIAALDRGIAERTSGGERLKARRNLRIHRQSGAKDNWL